MATRYRAGATRTATAKTVARTQVPPTTWEEAFTRLWLFLVALWFGGWPALVMTISVLRSHIAQEFNPAYVRLYTLGGPALVVVVRDVGFGVLWLACVALYRWFPRLALWCLWWLMALLAMDTAWDLLHYVGIWH